MSEPYVGEIRLVGFPFAPVGWALCDGSLLDISLNGALFSLIGTTYGGDGQSTFALPNLLCRVPMHQGNGHGPGEMGGAEAVTLTADQLAAHGHVPRASTAGGATDPKGSVWANSAALQFAPASSPLAAMNPGSIGSTGGGQPHENMLPFQVINFIICLEGIYPSQR